MAATSTLPLRTAPAPGSDAAPELTKGNINLMAALIDEALQTAKVRPNGHLPPPPPPPPAPLSSGGSASEGLASPRRPTHPAPPYPGSGNGNGNGNGPANSISSSPNNSPFTSPSGAFHLATPLKQNSAPELLLPHDGRSGSPTPSLRRLSRMRHGRLRAAYLNKSSHSGASVTSSVASLSELADFADEGAKTEALTKLYNSLLNPTGTGVDTASLGVVISKVISRVGEDPFGIQSDERALDENHAREVMRLLDYDGDGVLNYREFASAFDLFIDKNGNPTNFQVGGQPPPHSPG
jgi:hypothetical protein